VSSLPVATSREDVTATPALRDASGRSGEGARSAIESSRREVVLGVVCLVACPLISALFFGLVAMALAYAAGRGSTVALGSIVGGVAFVANALAICLTASFRRFRAVETLRAVTRSD
jgi:hypothetical protein